MSHKCLRDGKGRFKKSRTISRTAPLIAFGGFLAGIAMTLGFVAMGNQFPETELEQVYIGFIDEAPPAEADALVSAWSQAPVETPMPCQEDEIIIGVGDFHSNGLWDEYTCEPLDDVLARELGCPETETIATCIAPEVFEQQPLSTLYRVQEGDNLWTLAQAAGIDLETAEQFNDPSGTRNWDLIHVGEVLILG